MACFTTTRVSTRRNPFAGKCIHGKDGAFLHKGRQVNNACGHCRQQGRTAHDGR